MVGRDNQASSPLIDLLRCKQYRDPDHQGIPTRLCEASSNPA